MAKFYNKVKYVLGIVMVFSLILTTNLVDRDSFRSVRNSMVTIYEDRLLAKDLIYDMFGLVKEKELAVAVNDRTFFESENEVINRKIRDLVYSFEQTRLTDKETRIFDSLKRNFETLWSLEDTYISSGLSDGEVVIQHLERLEEDLQDLSDIQIEEGRKQLMISKRAVDTVELFTQIEIYVMIILAVVVQIVIMYRPKEKSEQDD